ncbi:hypothetical protein GEV33_009837 [Tenebrio molitor]|uniref:Uncharacterized protein n=1 Tax=Tenebrio molitor TaxID=7067 RepID=A0A8J6HE28_TENMO|nr:hypothetical protein GEV33_009837 [Tenebrio molitor]
MEKIKSIERHNETKRSPEQVISGRVLTFSRDPVWLRSGAGTGEAGSGRDRPGVPRESEITDVLVNAIGTVDQFGGGADETGGSDRLRWGAVISGRTSGKNGLAAVSVARCGRPKPMPWYRRDLDPSVLGPNCSIVGLPETGEKTSEKVTSSHFRLDGSQWTPPEVPLDFFRFERVPVRYGVIATGANGNFFFHQDHIPSARIITTLNINEILFSLSRSTPRTCSRPHTISSPGDDLVALAHPIAPPGTPIILRLSTINSVHLAKYGTIFEELSQDTATIFVSLQRLDRRPSTTFPRWTGAEHFLKLLRDFSCPLLLPESFTIFRFVLQYLSSDPNVHLKIIFDFASVICSHPEFLCPAHGLLPYLHRALIDEGGDMDRHGAIICVSFINSRCMEEYGIDLGKFLRRRVCVNLIRRHFAARSVVHLLLALIKSVRTLAFVPVWVREAAPPPQSAIWQCGPSGSPVEDCLVEVFATQSVAAERRRCEAGHQSAVRSHHQVIINRTGPGPIDVKINGEPPEDNTSVSDRADRI